jgi:hypothetical protein
MDLREAGLAEARRADMLLSTAADAGGMIALGDIVESLHQVFGGVRCDYRTA